MSKTIFTSASSFQDAAMQAKLRGYTVVGQSTKIQNGRRVYIVFARRGGSVGDGWL
jgi:hypothetical protein